MNREKHIWEGWTVGSFIDELEPMFDIVQDNAKGFGVWSFESKEDVKKWKNE